jgi:hypothetical protein
MKYIFLLLVAVTLGACNPPPQPPGPPPKHKTCKPPEGYAPWGKTFELGGFNEDGEEIKLFTVQVQKDGTAIVHNYGDDSERVVQPDTPFFLTALTVGGGRFYVELYLDCEGLLWTLSAPADEEVLELVKFLGT